MFSTTNRNLWERLKQDGAKREGSAPKEKRKEEINEELILLVVMSTMKCMNCVKTKANQMRSGE